MCTANQCRSPMAASLLRARVPEGVSVSSAGLLPGGAPATRDARRVVDGLDDHVSRQVSADLVDGAALVIAMERRHVREVVVSSSPSVFGRSFTLRELVRRASSVGPRRVGDGDEGESFDEWLGRVGAGRRIADLVGDDSVDDVADPIGQSLEVYRSTAAELSDLLDRFVALAWPGGAVR
jgi:protein-tyrosine phosphatase